MGTGGKYAIYADASTLIPSSDPNPYLVNPLSTQQMELRVMKPVLLSKKQNSIVRRASTSILFPVPSLTSWMTEPLNSSKLQFLYKASMPPTCCIIVILRGNMQKVLT